MYSDGRLFRPQKHHLEWSCHDRRGTFHPFGDYYCWLVDRRWRDFIHWIKAVSA